MVENKNSKDSAELKEEESKDRKSYKGKNFKKSGKGKKPTKARVGDPGNDFSWWAKEPELLRDCANFKCNYVAGTPIADTDIPFIPTGVACIALHPVYGCSKAPTDPLNVWARDLYLRMFQKYRGITSYSAADLGIAIIAAVECVRLIAVYERIYGIINRYSKINVNMPFTEVYGLDLTSSTADILRGRLSDFRYDLNFLIKKAQRLCVPKDMSVVADCISLFGYEYMDHNDPRAQIILFQPTHYGVYSDTLLQSGGSIEFKALPADLFDFTADNMCKALNTCLDALLGSDGIQKIFGDLVVWFGEEAMLQINPVPEDYVVLPVVSESILHKMHNLETLSDANTRIASVVNNTMSGADVASLRAGKHFIYQYDDNIVTQVSLASSSGVYTYGASGVWDYYLSSAAMAGPIQTHVLDTYRVDVDPEVIVEGVLLKDHFRTVTVGSDTGLFVTSAAIYIPIQIRLYKLTTAGTVSGTAMINVSTSSNNAQLAGGALAILDWAPLSYYTSAGIITEIFGDIDSVIPLYANDVSRLQRTITLSAFHTDMRVVSK